VLPCLPPEFSGKKHYFGFSFPLSHTNTNNKIRRASAAKTTCNISNPSIFAKKNGLGTSQWCVTGMGGSLIRQHDLAWLAQPQNKKIISLLK
jgi:hypothetical protein